MELIAHSMAILRCRCCGNLRDELKLTGAKFGCGIALCGSCTVHKNGEAIRSCVSAMRDMAGADVLAKLLKRVIPCCRNVNSISP